MRKSLKVLLIALVVSLSLGVITACKKTEEPKKTKLDSPVITSKTYTGSNQTATVAENEAYEVTVNEGGINVGEYDVVLTLTDTKKYEWANPDADDKTKVTLKFTITKATNEITVLTLDDWAYGETPKTPTAMAKFGTPEFTYATSENGTYSETVPIDAGDYWVKATVAETKNYAGATQTLKFTIAKAHSAITSNPAANQLTYNGEAQALVTAGESADGTLQYKLGADGEWSENIPIATNAGEYVVYFRLKGDKNHIDIESNLSVVNVTIAKAVASVTAPTAKTELVYNGNAQALASAGSVSDATLEYKLGDGEWGADVPAATNAGEYTVYYRVTVDNNHTGATEGSFKVAIAKAANEVTFSLDGEEIHCGDAVPTEFNATSVAGAITYAYSIDNVNFYPINGLGEDFKFEAGKTYYVKATAAESENYLSAYKVASIVATHKFGEGVENDGIITATCACGHKQVTGERTTGSTVDFAAAVGADGTISATAGELDISAVYSESAEGVKLTVNETEYNAAVVNGKITLKGVIPVTVYGNVKLGIKFTTENGEYDFTAPALIVTKKITDLDSFRAISAIEKLINGGGYYMFSNDVVLSGQDRFIRYYNNTVDYTIGAGNGQNGSTVDRPFVGTIDGNGYSLYNLGMSGWYGKVGFINNLGATGVLKNLGFIDVTLHGQSSIVANGSGLIENVYVKYKIYGSKITGAEFAKDQIVKQPQTTTFGTYGLSTNASFAMRNIVVDFTSVCADLSTIATTELHDSQYLLGAYSSKATFTNVVVLNVPKLDGHIVNADSETKVYVKYSDATDNGVELPVTNWDKKLWTANDGSLPAFNGMTANKDKGFTKSTSVIEVGASAEFTVPANCLLYLGENTPEGVTLENGVITVDESVAIGTTFTVCSKNIFDVANPVEITVTVSKKTVKFALETTTEVDLNAAADGGVVTVAGDDKTIDLTTVYNETSEAELTLNGVSLGTATINGGVLSFNTSVIPVSGTYGNVELKVKIEGEATDCEITVPMFVITKTISDKATLQSLKNYADSATMQGGGYYRLGADVEAGEWYTSYGASQEAAKDYRFGVTYAFKGTFDGNGYAIKKLVLTVPKSGYASGFIHKIDGGIIKNVAFTDLALGSDESLVYCGNGTFENIYVRYSAVTGFASDGTGTAPSSGWASVLCGPFFTSTENDKFSHAILTNVVIDLSVISDAAWAAGKSQCIIGAFDNLSVMNNVAVIGMKKDFRSGNKGKLVRSEMGYLDYVGLGGGNTPYYAYLQYSDGTEETGDKFAAFPATGWADNYWTVDADNKSITWKTK